MKKESIMVTKLLKRSLSILLAAALISSLSACSDTDSSNSGDDISRTAYSSEDEWFSMITKGAVEDFLELANDDAYVEAVAGSDSLISLIDEWNDAEPDPDEVYYVNLSDEAMEVLIESMGDIDIDDFSPVGRETALSRIKSGIPSLLTSRLGGVRSRVCSGIEYNSAYKCLRGSI